MLMLRIRMNKKNVDLAGSAINIHEGKFLVRGGKVLNIEGK